VVWDSPSPSETQWEACCRTDANTNMNRRGVIINMSVLFGKSELSGEMQMSESAPVVYGGT